MLRRFGFDINQSIKQAIRQSRGAKKTSNHCKMVCSWWRLRPPALGLARRLGREESLTWRGNLNGGWRQRKKRLGRIAKKIRLWVQYSMLYKVPSDTAIPLLADDEKGSVLYSKHAARMLHDTGDTHG